MRTGAQADPAYAAINPQELVTAIARSMPAPAAPDINLGVISALKTKIVQHSLPHDFGDPRSLVDRRPRADAR